DVAVIEVGLGGRLDSTNIIRPEVSVITNISLDHTNLLGSTVQEIALEKAGIIKQAIPVVIGETQTAVKTIFEEKAGLLNAPIFFADENMSLKDKKLNRGQLLFSVYEDNKLCLEKLNCDLAGSYQEKNILTVLKTIGILNDKKSFQISPNAIYAGLKNVKKLTHLQGRWQIIQRNPLMVCDTGHNVAGILEVLKNINQTKFRKLHIVFGMVKDKAIDEILALLPKDAAYYFCSPNIERGLDEVSLMERANCFDLKGNAFPSVDKAKAAALSEALKQDFIFIGGSTFVVAEALP
ncbi:MAG: bifunctional folylpolyglutamate synthase/dihydrofolate synthase, partial [Pedobacter sp.]|nr:bifunctional folylpolyglutamate synthase/dihydrofolate synthase [Pedobacter sp.]